MIMSEKKTLTVAAAATSATHTTGPFHGRVVCVKVDPGAAMATSATLKIYGETDGLGAPDYFFTLTFPASEAEMIVYPLVPTTTNDGATATNPLNYVPRVVDGPIKIDLASAAAADAVTVTVFVES
jgi:hypothetical protein